jgi:hypothetical protein
MEIPLCHIIAAKDVDNNTLCQQLLYCPSFLIVFTVLELSCIQHRNFSSNFNIKYMGETYIISSYVL